MKYERVGIYFPEEVLPYIVFNSLGEINNNPIKRIYDDYEVKMTSLRYRTFLISGLSCKKCGLIGRFFALEKPKYQSKSANPNERYHFNLYGINSNGEEIMITKDHIIPVSKGGTDTIENLQTMCSICNEEKKDELHI